MSAVTVGEVSGVVGVESDFYRVGFEGGEAAHCGAVEFLVKGGENANKVTTPSDKRKRPFGMVLEEVFDYYYTPQHSYSVVEAGGVRGVVRSLDGAFAGVGHSRTTFSILRADEQVVGYPDRFLVRYAWRNEGDVSAAVFSNAHEWWYTNGFYSQASMVKRADLLGAYDGGTFDCGFRLRRWNSQGAPYGVSDDSSSGRLAHWWKAFGVSVPAHSSDQVQVLCVFVQPPGSSVGSVDVLGRMEDYGTPDMPAVGVGALRLDSPGDDDGDGFNEGDGAYHFNCSNSRVAFSLDVERGGAEAVPFYYPAFVLHGYDEPTAPVLRLNGELLGGERGARHEGDEYEGTGYSSKVLSDGCAVLWLNGVLDEDAVVEVARGFAKRRLVRVGWGVSG